MSRRAATLAGAAAMALAIALSVLWFVRERSAVPRSAVDAARLIRVTRTDAFGVPTARRVVRDAARARTLAAALGIDGHRDAPCPPDYSDAPVSLVITGRDAYERRSVYLYGDGGAVSVLSVTTAGCRRGPAADPEALARELAAP